MVTNKSDEINAVMGSGQKITAFSGSCWLKKFMELLGVVFARDLGIKKCQRGFSEQDFFIYMLYLFMSDGKAISGIGKIRVNKAFKRLSGLTRAFPRLVHC